MKREIGRSGSLRVETYDTGDLFVRDDTTGVMIRVGHHGDALVVTAQTSLMEPYAVNGLPAVRIRRRTQ